MTHDIILQRYIELDGELKAIMTVVKSRGRPHKRELRTYEITKKGIVVGDVIRGYEGVITAVPRFVGNYKNQADSPKPSTAAKNTKRRNTRERKKD